MKTLLFVFTHNRIYSIRGFHKRRPHKIAKNWSSSHLSTKYLQWLNSSCPCGHTINIEKSEVFCTKKYGRPHLKNSPLSALDKPPFGRLLWTTPTSYNPHQRLIMQFYIQTGNPSYINLLCDSMHCKIGVYFATYLSFLYF